MKFKKNVLAIALLSMMPTLAMSAEATSFSDAITGGKVSGMLRLRYEHVSQDNALKNADALTLRSLVGYQTKALNGFSANVQVYALSSVNDNYNDAKKGSPINSRKQYSVIADPEDIDFHQAYFQWSNQENTVKLGRQNMFLDNWRFIGDVRFRQNWAVFNGLSYVNTSLPNTTVTLAHFEKLKQVTTKLVDIQTEVINVGYKLTPTTKVVGYGYLHENKDAAATSIETYGLRIDGKEKINDQFAALFTAEYAKQDDYADAKNIDNDYYYVSAGLGFGGWGFRINQEMMSGTDSSSVRAFQTPLGTNHLFTGWSDLFLATPGTGIKDTFLTAVGNFKGAKIKAQYHLIDADNSNAAGDDEYGTEFDLGVYYKFKKNVIGSFEYANFQQKDKSLGKPDTEKFWVTGIYKF